MDREHRRLFSAGRNPQMLVIMDADSGKVIQSFPISGGTDAAAYDPESKLIFVSTREGNIHVFHEDSPDQYSMVDTVKTQVGAKTMGLDSKTHRLFLDTSDFGTRRPRSVRIRSLRPCWAVFGCWSTGSRIASASGFGGRFGLPTEDGLAGGADFVEAADAR